MSFVFSRSVKSVVLAAGFTAALLALPAFAEKQQGNLTEQVAPALEKGQLSNGAPLSFASLVETVSPAVVSVSVEREIERPPVVGNIPGFENAPEQFRRMFPRRRESNPAPRRAQSQGSGFIIEASGYIVTNNHVIAEADTITVTLSGGDTLDAKLIGTDPGTDLALLKVESRKPLPYVPFSKKDDLKVGDWVVAVGNPFGLGGTVTAGIVSARERAVGSVYNDFIQIDAPINQGNSGGPTFDLNGRVVGVNTLIFSPSGGNVGIGFAIPASIATEVVAELKASGEVTRGYLGVNIQGISEDVAEGLGMKSNKGAIVVEVTPDAPAERAGIKEGDVILKINGQEVDDVRHLTQLVGKVKPGSKAKFRILRDGKAKTVTAKIEKRGDLAPTGQNENNEPKEDDAAEALGLDLVALNDDLRDQYGIDDGIAGVFVRDMDPASDAAQKGIRPGDVIARVGTKWVKSPDDIMREVTKAKKSGKKNITMFVKSRNGGRFVAVGIGEPE